MSEQTPFAFSKLIPGFDFLQQLTKGGVGGTAGAAASGLAHWVAPTVNVEELEQRITELKAVQFWLEQNLLALKATVQALEVQKMTLATLRGMNLNVAEVAKAFSLPKSEAAPASPLPAGAGGWPFQSESTAASGVTPSSRDAAVEPPDPEPAAEPASPEKAKVARRRTEASAPPASEPAAAGMADPMQWWGALTQQFQQIAAETMREAAHAMPAAAAEALATGQRTRKKPSAAAKKAASKGGARKKPAANTRTKADVARAPAAAWPLPSALKRDRS